MDEDPLDLMWRRNNQRQQDRGRPNVENNRHGMPPNRGRGFQRRPQHRSLNDLAMGNNRNHERNIPNIDDPNNEIRRQDHFQRHGQNINERQRNNFQRNGQEQRNHRNLGRNIPNNEGLNFELRGANRHQGPFQRHGHNRNERPRPNFQRIGHEQRNPLNYDHNIYINENLDDEQRHHGPFQRHGQNVNDGQRRNFQRSNQSVKTLGFKTLQEMVQVDARDILGTMNQRKEAFQNLIQSPIDNTDIFILVVELLSKICESSFEELKLRYILDVCNSPFVKHLRNCLMDLPTDSKNRTNSLYWNDPDKFWNNYVIFLECVFNMIPSIALQKCRTLFESTSKVCLEEMRNRHNYELSQANNMKLLDLRERLQNFEKTEEQKVQQRRGMFDDEEEQEPPEDFRQLSVVPLRDDLLNTERPFVRANLVQGAYRDLEHYLDVQFRLLREDCFGPLREGLNQYVDNPNKKKYDNIRVYKNVQYIAPYVSQTKVGIVVQLDENAMKRLKRINWSHSKRFIFGSLLLFTNDHCRSFICATILDRDIKYLSQGQLPITIVNTSADDMAIGELKKNENYVMIESEVYFEPYQLVMKALQDPSFPQHLAMSKYIVNVDPTPRHPAYLDITTKFKVRTEYEECIFNVLNLSTWPSAEDLNLNDSQYEAYKLALTHEFAVIQGPPGTGKTFIGVKVAKTLIENVLRGSMLVICYTNHALDQFLEHILNITNSVVRIGGQSRNPAMEIISLNNLRRAKRNKEHQLANKQFYEERNRLKIIMAELHTAQKRIQSLSDGVLAYNSLKDYISETEHLLQYYNSDEGDILAQWLFELMHYVKVDELLLQTDNTNNIEDDPVDEDEQRTPFILDDLMEGEHEINGVEIKTSFTLFDAKRALNQMILQYKMSNDLQEKEMLSIGMRELNSRIILFMEMKENYYRNNVPREIQIDENLSRLPINDRWAIYFNWGNKAMNKIKAEIQPLQEKANTFMNTYEEARMYLDLQLIKGLKVVGMTTSGAARLQKLLQALQPKIVIVEEAAEVLEQHIVTSLTKNCQHLILIGDHQQLRPSVAYIKLARHYNIEVSLFERMILNNMHSRTLGVQHRMRPEIAALISPHIYPDLINHRSVDAFPQVRGITSSLFFFTHNYIEEGVDDSSSRSNEKEADMVLSLANYLMQQGYNSEDVTILAAYTGQLFYMKKQRLKHAFLDKVKITVVDNYQGEESKIILLSLVRNNNENKIGFLGTPNRICVALSRAKEGFFIFGNIDILKTNSPLWTKIATTLEEKGCIGTRLQLKCENHRSQLTTINDVKDFEKVPEGGCLLKCNYNLPCGHRCPQICHGYDRDHSKTKCQLKCEREICELGHECPLKCWKKCQPCRRLVPKILPCGHQQNIFCFMDPTDPSVKCNTTVTVRLPNCDHETKKPCYVDLKSVKCTVLCVYRIEKCGHQCRRYCHVTDDPDHEKYLCEKPCANAKKGCTANLLGDRGNHQCLKMCYQTCDDCNVEVKKKRSKCTHSAKVACCKNVDDTPCMQKCARVLPCGHFCKKKCHMPCGDCDQKVKKPFQECDHMIEIACKEEPKREMCMQPCSRKMTCGHACRARCGQPCDPYRCEYIITVKNMQSPCGHDARLPCNIYKKIMNGSLPVDKTLLEYCNEPCNATLKCDHICRGSCAKCLQGRVHAPCTQPCHVTMICGHQCEEPCNNICPPCKKQCEVKCTHSRCSKLCGAPCVVCKEKCERKCPHRTCARRCGEPCVRVACDRPCPKRLRCGHPCRGLCGEVCPNICKICNQDSFPKDFLGDDFEDDTIFIQLEDCTHVLSVEDADNLMQGDSETVKIRTCPLCRKPIINTGRYKDLVNHLYKTEINPVKEKVYGTEDQVKAKRELLNATLTALKETNAKLFQENDDFNQVYIVLQQRNREQKKMSVLQIDMHILCIDILKMLMEYYQKYNLAKLTLFKSEFLNQIKIVCKAVANNINKISQQQQQDLGNEIKRMNSIIQFATILNHPSYLQVKNVPEVFKDVENAKNKILSWKIYIENDAVIALKKLQEDVKLRGIVTKEERELIVKAIGLKQGHWFKCPNGHFYCIGECGGAMQTSRCIECGASIGGGSHTLLATNSLAPEMDGARFAAWSQEYNNMANFRLD